MSAEGSGECMCVLLPTGVQLTLRSVCRQYTRLRSYILIIDPATFRSNVVENVLHPHVRSGIEVETVRNKKSWQSNSTIYSRKPKTG